MAPRKTSKEYFDKASGAWFAITKDQPKGSLMCEPLISRIIDPSKMRQVIDDIVEPHGRHYPILFDMEWYKISGRMGYRINKTNIYDDLLEAKDAQIMFCLEPWVRNLCHPEDETEDTPPGYYEDYAIDTAYEYGVGHLIMQWLS